MKNEKEMSYIYSTFLSGIIYSQKNNAEGRIIDVVSSEMLKRKYSFDDDYYMSLLDRLNQDKSKWIYPSSQEEYKNELIKKNLIRYTYEQCQQIKNLNYNPQINMSKDEVLNSLWGKPLRVNKTTTSYGTTEQWVYSRNRYVYFNEYGFVTTIQE